MRGRAERRHHPRRAGRYERRNEGRVSSPASRSRPWTRPAAGDVFNGALAVALAEGRSREAVRFANAAAAISVTRLGAQPSAPMRKEIEGLLDHERIRP